MQKRATAIHEIQRIEAEARAKILIESPRFQQLLENIRAKRNGQQAPHRPSEYTPECVQTICASVAKGAPLKDAAADGGIDYGTLARWRNEEDKEEFREALARAEALFKARHTTNIEAHSVFDWKASAFLLERRFPKDFGAKETVEHEHAHEHTHKADANLCKLIADSFATLAPRLKAGHTEVIDVQVEKVSSDPPEPV